MSTTREAEQAATEAVDGSPRSVTFGQGKDAITLNIPRKWKRFKFMRRLNSGDMVGALEVVFGEERVEMLDELEITEEEFTDALETIAQALGGVKVGNS